ncbi:MAG: hypothetical protein IPI74_05535 [Bacteroidales bacterium]|nr:hypothetical protein [Bacteroidales bacterium]
MSSKKTGVSISPSVARNTFIRRKRQQRFRCWHESTADLAILVLHHLANDFASGNEVRFFLSPSFGNQ